MTSNVERELFKKKALYSTDALLQDVLDAIMEVDGEKQKDNEDDIIYYFSNKMSTINIPDIPPLDLNFMISYDKNFGFIFNLKSITSIEDKGKIL